MEFSDFAGLRAMLFRADGSMLMIKSRSRSRDAYHPAALIAHQQLLDPMSAHPRPATVLDGFSEMGGSVATQALGGQAVVVHLCDSEFRSLDKWTCRGLERP
jgi:hypothetical protein